MLPDVPDRTDVVRFLPECVADRTDVVLKLAECCGGTAGCCVTTGGCVPDVPDRLDALDKFDGWFCSLQLGIPNELYIYQYLP